jgi:hypothetical protein
MGLKEKVSPDTLPSSMAAEQAGFSTPDNLPSLTLKSKIWVRRYHQVFS